MSNLYTQTVSLFYQLANLFFWPVAISLIVLFSWALFDLGRTLYQAWWRRREARTDLLALARDLKESHGADLDATLLSPALLRFWVRVQGRVSLLDASDDLDLWLEDELRAEEMRVTATLDRSRALIRLGPMLGLAGTIIPLGPALQSLLGGDMETMVNHLVVGFGAVVCGLVLSGIAYAVTLVRERWARVDLKDLETFCELLLRTRQQESTPEDRSIAHART